MGVIEVPKQASTVGALDDRLRPLLAPGSVAVVGASDKAGNLGARAIRSMLRFGYRGKIYPINPNQEQVEGLQCQASVANLSSVPELAIFALGAQGLPAAIEACAAAGIRHGIAWAGGFADAGAEGAKRQAQLAEVCRDLDFQLCGPNCLGIINAALGFTGTFSSSLLSLESLLPSSLAIVSQSGGIAGQAMGLASRAGFGFNHVISCGNEAVLSAADFVQGLAADNSVSAIALYLESVVDGDKFIESLDLAAKLDKPVVVLKGGASEASSRASLAHTGRLGGSDRAFDAVLREFGAIRVHSLEELVDTALLIESLNGVRPEGPRVAVTTFGGGAGVLAVDQCLASGLEMADIPADTSAAMEKRMTPLASLANPIDMTPQSMNDPALRAQLPTALSLLPQASTVDAVLFLCASNSDNVGEMVEIIGALRKSSNKPVVVSWSLSSPEADALLAQRGVYSFPETTRATRALGNLVRRRAALGRRLAPSPSPDREGVDWAGMVGAQQGTTVVTEDRVAQIVEVAGLGVARGRLVRHVEELEAVLAAVPRPWAMKGISPAIPHRASAGLVALHVSDLEQARQIFARFEALSRAQGAPLEGVYVQEMIKDGAEILVSAISEPTFGPMVTIGAGGNLTELIDDVMMARAPVSEQTALLMLGSLRFVRAGRLDDTARGHAARYIAEFSRLAATAPWQRFTFELNPVKCSADGATAIDGLLVVEPDSQLTDSASGMAS